MGGNGVAISRAKGDAHGQDGTGKIAGGLD